MNTILELPYTIAFCLMDDRVLMLHRKSPPNQHLWNGVGGWIEPGETPAESIAREIMEETGLDVQQALVMDFVGLVTWTYSPDAGNRDKGMYAYLVKFADDAIGWHDKLIDEGRLEWKALAWVVDTANRQVVDNIPHFLPPMLDSSAPVRYHCHYDGGHFERLSVHPLPGHLL